MSKSLSSLEKFINNNPEYKYNGYTIKNRERQYSNNLIDVKNDVKNVNILSCDYSYDKINCPDYCLMSHK